MALVYLTIRNFSVGSQLIGVMSVPTQDITSSLQSVSQNVNKPQQVINSDCVSFSDAYLWTMIIMFLL